jgi:putative flavoprotein involved in K+ transport
VLVVGAGASGIQIAAELARSGRDVVLSTGRHARAVRSYRGRDLWWWLERIGSLDQTVDEVADLEAARRTPSLGLTGVNGGENIDLGSLQRLGIRIAGRSVSVDGSTIRFGENLAGDVATADRRLHRLLERFDAHATESGIDHELDPPAWPTPVPLDRVVDDTDIGTNFATIIWATGYERDHPWLDPSVLDDDGEIIQRRGVTPMDGLYVLGMRFQWTRGSHFIDRVGRDAEHVAAHIAERTRERSGERVPALV